MRASKIKGMALALQFGPDAFIAFVMASHPGRRRVTLSPQTIERLLAELGPDSACLLLEVALEQPLGGPLSIMVVPGERQSGWTPYEYAKTRMRAVLGKVSPGPLVIAFRAISLVSAKRAEEMREWRRLRRASAASDSSDTKSVVANYFRKDGPVYNFATPLAERLAARTKIEFLKQTALLGWGCAWDSGGAVDFAECDNLDASSWEQRRSRIWGCQTIRRKVLLAFVRLSPDWLCLRQKRGGMTVLPPSGRNPWLLLGRDAEGDWVGARPERGKLKTTRLKINEKGRGVPF